MMDMLEKKDGHRQVMKVRLTFCKTQMLETKLFDIFGKGGHRQMMKIRQNKILESLGHGINIFQKT